MSPVLIMLIFGAFCMILSTLFGGAYYMGYFDTNSSSSSTDPDSSSSSSSSSSNSSSSSTDPDSSSIPLCYQAQSLDCESNEYSNIVTMPPGFEQCLFNDQIFTVEDVQKLPVQTISEQEIQQRCDEFRASLNKV